MRFTQKQPSRNAPHWEGQKNNFAFRISYRDESRKTFFVVASHRKKNIRFNSLWENKVFASLEEAQEFCESFNYTQHKVLGEGVEKNG